MNRALTLICAITVATILPVLHPTAAHACSPPPNWTPEPREHAAKRLYSEAAVIFVGTAVSKTEETYQMRDPSFPALRVSVSLTVSETIKGPVQETEVVKTGTGRGDCGDGEIFFEGATYLIYATPYNDTTLWVSRVITASEMDDELAILREAPRLGIGMPKAGNSSHAPIAIIALMGALALVVGFVVRRDNTW